MIAVILLTIGTIALVALSLERTVATAAACLILAGLAYLEVKSMRRRSRRRKFLARAGYVTYKRKL